MVLDQRAGVTEILHNLVKQPEKLSVNVIIGILFIFFFANYSFGGSFTKMDGATIYFQGIVGPGDASNLKSLMDSKTKLLVVQSGGGLSWEAQEMGRLIQEAGIDVVVQGSCLSACANSLFLSGKNKYLSDSFKIDQKMYDFGGIVCFHGGAIGRSDEALLDMKKLKPSYLSDIKTKGQINLFGKIIKSEKDFDDFLNYIQDVNGKELDFLNSQKIDQKILLIHKTVGADLACPTAAGFKSLGVTGVHGDMIKKYVPKNAKVYDVEVNRKDKKQNSDSAR